MAVWVSRWIAFLAVAIAVPVHAEVQQRWYTLSVAGERTGYARVEHKVTETRTVDRLTVAVVVTQLRRRISTEQRIDVVRDLAGTPTHMTVQFSAADMKRGWRGEIQHDPLILMRNFSGSTQRTAIPLSVDTVLPDRLPAALTPLWRNEIASTRFDYLDPASAQVMTLSAERLSESRSNDAQAHIRLSKPGVARQEDYWFDNAGTLQRLEQDFLGTRLTWTLCVSDCDREVDVPFDPMQLLVVRSPFHIPAKSMHGRIRYVIARDDNQRPTLQATAEQSVVSDGNRVIVTVCDRCNAEPQGDATDRSVYTRSNRWVQSEDPAIVRFAKRVDARASTDERMERLTRAVRRHMTGRVNYLGYSTAVDALRDRSGDCSEVAVLLAAVARASGIPARIVGGLAYADRFSGKKDVFSPHVWVQTWNGMRWVSYDAALDSFDATHIAISIGDGNPQMFAGYLPELQLWRIEKAGAIRPE